MDKEKNRKKAWLIIAAALLFMVIGGAVGVEATSTTQFCMTCHEMGPNHKEMKFSTHAKDKDGKPITCVQCHLPKGLGVKFFSVKAYSGIKDLFIHNFGDPDDLYRAEMQVTARRFIDDANCLACHADLSKDAKGEKPVSELGKIAHDAYLGKNGNVRNGCANCHINLAHLPSFDRNLIINEKFASRIMKQEEWR